MCVCIRCMYPCVFMYLYVCMHLYVYICHGFFPTYIHTYKRQPTPAHTTIWITHIRINIHTHIHICIQIYMHTCIHTQIGDASVLPKPQPQMAATLPPTPRSGTHSASQALNSPRMPPPGRTILSPRVYGSDNATPEVCVIITVCDFCDLCHHLVCMDQIMHHRYVLCV